MSSEKVHLTVFREPAEKLSRLKNPKVTLKPKHIEGRVVVEMIIEEKEATK